MAITPLGNSNFIQQNAPLASTHLSNEQAKTSFATIANLSEFQEKEKLVDKLEKVNESHEIKEEIKEKKDEEGQKKRKQDEKKEPQDLELVLEEDKENEDLEPKDSQKMKRLDLSI